MAHTLEFLIVLASMTATVIRYGSGIRMCPEERYQKLVDKGSECRYEPSLRQTTFAISPYKVQRDFQGSIYAHTPSATAYNTLLVKEVGCDERPALVDNATLFWEYECEIAAVANIVPDGRTEFFKIERGSCQVYTFTIKEQWDRECEIRDNLREHIKYTTLYKNISSEVPKNIRKKLWDRTFSSLKKKICNRMNEDLHTASNLTKNDLPIPLTVNISHIVDKSLTRFRVNIANDRVENIELKNIRFPVYVTRGDFKGHVVFTGGIFEDFSTIERVGDALATIQADMYNIRSTFTIRQARVHFDSYHFPSYEAPFNDTISLIIQNSQIQLEHSGFRDSGACNESVWVNITRMSVITNQFSNFKPDLPMLFNTSTRISSTHEAEMKEILAPYLVRNLLQYGATDWSNYTYGPCMSNSSKVWHKDYASQTDYHFT